MGAKSSGVGEYGNVHNAKGALMKKALAGMLLLAGASIPMTTANAAVFSSVPTTRVDTAGSMLVQVQQRRAVRVAPRTTNRVAPRTFGRVGPRARVVGPRARVVGPRARVVVPRGRVVGPRARVVIPRGRIGPRGVVVHRRGFRPAGFVRWHPRHLIYRRWHRRPYYGTIIGGVALGTILAASAYYAYASAPPAPGLCWFWADADEQQGYWDYCVE